MKNQRSSLQDSVEKDEREGLLRQFEQWWERPVELLGLVWLILLVYQLLPQEQNAIVETLIVIIWAIFLLDFGIRITLSTSKFAYIKRNTLTILSLLIPGLRFVRAFRLIPLVGIGTRSLRLLSIISSLNRGMRTTRRFLGQHRTGYVLSFSALVTFVGAAGMYAFESHYPGGKGFDSYGDALWWTAMIMTTVGSQDWPVSPEGRVLCFLLSLYAFGAFGYITAALAAFFIGPSGRR